MLENGQLNVVQGSGRFIETPCNSEYVYQRVELRDQIKPQKVEREPYTGPVVDPTKEAENGHDLDDSRSPNKAGNNQFHHRPPTKSGGRNMQDSSFCLGGDQWDDTGSKTSTRVKNPPGGKSSVIF